MRKKELMKKGLTVLLSSAILISGCASKANSKTSAPSKGNAITENDNTKQDTDNTTLENDTDTSTNNTKTSENDSKPQKTEEKSPKNESNASPSSNTEKTEDEDVIFTNISNGPIYDAIQSIDPDLQVQDANSGEYLAVTMDKPGDNIDTKATIYRFLWDAVQFLKTEVIKDTYTSVRFTFLGNDFLETFGVNNFKNFDDFMTSYIGPISKNEDVKTYFPVFYKSIFATKDTSVATEKTMYELSKKYGQDYELPDNYQEGYLWIAANFNYDCGFSIKENVVTVEIPAENTIESGTNTYTQIIAALEALNKILADRPELFPYEKLSIICIDKSTGSTLATRIIEKNTYNWETTTNTASGDFFKGLNNASSSSDTSQQTTDNESQQQTSANYILNTSTMKIHKPSCSAVKKIATENYSTSDSTIADLEAQGYSRCGICLK